jgi:ATP-dependent Zn protease
MPSILKKIFAAAFILLLTVLIWNFVEQYRASKNQHEISYSDLLVKVQSGDVQDAVVDGNLLSGHLKASSNAQFRTILPVNYEDLQKAMIIARVNLSIKEERTQLLAPVLVNFIPFVVLILAALLAIPPFWVIFRKAGFQPVLSILVLVPLANLIVLYIVAFSRWKDAAKAA